jgi:hypothetical protein
MPDRAGWREPTSLLPLRWGSYRWRYVAAVALLFAGGLLMQASSVYAGFFLTIGGAAHLAGWWIVPGRGWPRFWMSLPSVGIMVLLLTGGYAFVALVVPLLGWLLVRRRPALSYLAIVVPIVSGILLGQLFPQYGFGGIVVGISTAAMVLAAWIGRGLATSRRIPSNSEAQTG